MKTKKPARKFFQHSIRVEIFTLQQPLEGEKWGEVRRCLESLIEALRDQHNCEAWYEDERPQQRTARQCAEAGADLEHLLALED